MIKFRFTLFIGLSLIQMTSGFSQSLSKIYLDSCHVWAKHNYPLTRQFELIEKSKDYSIDNTNKTILPHFSIAGQATYQSEVTQLPVNVPNLSTDPLSNDQYKLYGEISQPITDLFTIKNNKGLINANSKIEEQKIEVELYTLRERINNLFFGILLIDAQIQQIELLKLDLKNGLTKINTAITYGVALKSDADNLQAELLKSQQRIIELKANRNSYVKMLSLFIGNTIDENTILIMPEEQSILNEIKRPELKLYDFQKSAIDYQNKLLKAKNLPRFSLFLQSGVGRPALNLLSNEFEPYYIGGLKLNWNFSSLYTYKTEKKILDLNRSGIELQREVFLFNTDLSLKQQDSEISKYQELIKTDQEILLLRERIKITAQNQLEFGTATTNDYLIAVNAKEQAQLNLTLHQIQLLMSQYNHKTTSGN